MNEKSIKLIQELLSGKAVLLTDENLENFLQKCKLTCSDKEEDRAAKICYRVKIFGCDLKSFIEYSQQMESQRVA